MSEQQLVDSFEGRTHLEQLVEYLKSARQAFAAYDNEVDDIVEWFKFQSERGEEYRQALERRDQEAHRVSELEAAVKVETVAVYTATGNKKPAPGVGIRVYKGKLRVVDTVAAIEWAKSAMPVAVIESIDEKQVLAWAEAQGDEPPAFIERDDDRVTATISKTL